MTGSMWAIKLIRATHPEVRVPVRGRPMDGLFRVGEETVPAPVVRTDELRPDERRGRLPGSDAFERREQRRQGCVGRAGAGSTMRRRPCSASSCSRFMRSREASHSKESPQLPTLSSFEVPALEGAGSRVTSAEAGEQSQAAHEATCAWI